MLTLFGFSYMARAAYRARAVSFLWALAVMIVTNVGVLHAKPAVDADNQRLAAYLSELNTMQADFRQKTLDANGTRVLQENQGHMVFKKPDLFRWSVEKPVQQLIVTNGKKLWIFDVDLEQVSVQPVQKDQHDKPAMVLLSDASELQRHYFIRAFRDHKPGEWFELTPRNESLQAQFSTLALYFENKRLKQLQFADAAGQLSNIDFTRVKYNVSVNPKTFDFTPPKGVDVVGMN